MMIMEKTKYLIPSIKLSALLFLAFLTFAFARSAKALEITFYQRGYVEGGRDAATRLTDAAVKEFERRNPGVMVRVVGVPWEKDGELKLRTALLARRRIDLFRLPHDTLPEFIPRRGGMLSPVDPYLTPADRADFSSASLAAVTVRGRVMAWPLWSTALVLIANPRKLAECGVAPPPEGRPWTWAEFTAALRRLRAGRPLSMKAAPGASPAPAGGGVGAFNAPAQGSIFEWAPLLFAHCGPIFVKGAPPAPDGSLPLSPGLAAALGEVRALVAEGLTAPSFGTDDQASAQADFLAGRTAILMSSPSFIKTLTARAVPFLILPPPTGRLARPITFGAVGCIAVVDSGDPARLAAAHALARWLTSAGIAAAVPGWYLAPPARASVTSFYDDQPAFRPLRAILPTVLTMTPPVSAGFMETTVIPKLAAAALGQVSPEEAVTEIQAAARRQALR